VKALSAVRVLPDSVNAANVASATSIGLDLITAYNTVHSKQTVTECMTYIHVHTHTDAVGGESHIVSVHLCCARLCSHHRTLVTSMSEQDSLCAHAQQQQLLHKLCIWYIHMCDWCTEHAQLLE
jgi:hypothetical protein